MKKLLLALNTGFFIGAMLLAACEPMVTLQIKNDTAQTLNVFVAFTTLDHVDIRDTRIPEGPVEPGKVLRFEDIRNSSKTYLIEARDAQGNLVYLQEFKFQELEKANWKVVISASQ